VGLFMVPWALFAQDVSLTSRDGSIRIDGTLLSHDGEFYRVETIYGPLTLDGEGVTCAGAGCPDLTAFVAEVTFSGTRRMADVLIPALIQAFASRNQLQLTREVESDTVSTFVLRNAERVVARFGLRATSTSEGFADLIAEVADIAMVLREPSGAEITMARESGAGTLVKGRRARVVALDGIVAIVALDQPVKTLSLQQLAAAFSGEAQSWAALGGADVPVVVKAPPGNVGLSEAFAARVMRPFGKKLSDEIERFPSLEELADTVAQDSFALGLTTLSEIGNADPVGLAGGCGFEQWPSLAALRAEDYPLTLPLMLYTPARRLPLLAREFLEFASSSAAHVVIRRAGFVDQSITRTGFNHQGDRLAHAILRAGPEIPLEELQRLVDTLRNRERLSTTFRFEAGTRLDVQSSENIFRLARAMETGAFDGKSLLFAGFSDGEGPAVPNKTLALERAQMILEQVREAAEVADFSQIAVSAAAFGEALPMACDDTNWGRAINRRVEVWVK
jgi:phosphate transport system substrate-binding protein